MLTYIYIARWKPTLYLPGIQNIQDIPGDVRATHQIISLWFRFSNFFAFLSSDPQQKGKGNETKPFRLTGVQVSLQLVWKTLRLACNTVSAQKVTSSVCFSELVSFPSLRPFRRKIHLGSILVVYRRSRSCRSLRLSDFSFRRFRFAVSGCSTCQQKRQDQSYLHSPIIDHLLQFMRATELHTRLTNRRVKNQFSSKRCSVTYFAQ